MFERDGQSDFQRAVEYRIASRVEEISEDDRVSSRQGSLCWAGPHEGCSCCDQRNDGGCACQPPGCPSMDALRESPGPVAVLRSVDVRQICGHLESRRWPVLRIAGDRLQDGALELRIDAWCQRGQARRGLLRSGHVIRLASDELVQHDTECVHIRAFRDASVRCELLGRHVSERADHELRSGIAGRDCDPEVGDSDSSILIDEHVGGFQVAMQNALGVSRSEPATQLVGDFEHAFRRQTAGALEKGREILSLHEFH